MEDKKVQEPILDSKVFKIPIEEFENDLNTAMVKGKKNEILELFTNSNNLHTKEEFDEIKYNLHEACRKCDFDLIKIYLKETIKNESKTFTFKIDKTNHTASLLKINDKNIKEVIIPRTIEHESVEYIITSISGTNKIIQILKFDENSEVKTIYGSAFSKSSNIREIYFPSSLKELKEGWCNVTYNLTKIIISPLNSQFKLIEDKYLIGKSDSKKDEYDILLFGSRDIKEISIPSNIKIISSYAFESCSNLTKVEFETNFNLQIIESYSFNSTNIKEIFIPSKVSKICENAFSYCKSLTKIEIPQNSNLQTIESQAFSDSKIKQIFIPSNVSKLSRNVFINCKSLTKIEIPPNSSLQTIESNVFFGSNIKDIFIPSNVSKINENAFNNCKNLQILEISEESKLESFPLTAFCLCPKLLIMIPSSLKKLIK